MTANLARILSSRTAFPRKTPFSYIVNLTIEPDSEREAEPCEY